MIRVLLVDHYVYSRQALALALEEEENLTVVGQAGTLHEVELALDQDPADVAVVEPALPEGQGLTVIRTLLATHPSPVVIALTASKSPLIHTKAIEAGAIGVLQRTVSLPELIEAIRRVARGEVLLTPRDLIMSLRLAAQLHEEEDALRSLTFREVTILKMLTEGLRNKDIAEQLAVSENTVKAHTASIMRKLEVTTRLAAAVFAKRHGLGGSEEE